VNFVVAGKEKKRLDVLAHEVVPRHSILTKKETEEVLHKYSIRLVNLPRIYHDDPAVIALGARENDVIEITRKSKTIVDKIQTYRFVVRRRV
jgi:DNA-directed RNA polymerase subunit H